MNMIFPVQSEFIECNLAEFPDRMSFSVLWLNLVWHLVNLSGHSRQFCHRHHNNWRNVDSGRYNRFSIYLITRPEKELFRSWWETFLKHYRDPEFEEFYSKDQFYTIFIHQAILSGVILSKLKKEELEELPFEYNYPLHLFNKKPIEICKIVTARYEGFKSMEKIVFDDEFKEWLYSQIDS